MHPDLDSKRDALAALCRQFGVGRLDVFGAATRARDFDPRSSDTDCLVTFLPAVQND